MEQGVKIALYKGEICVAYNPDIKDRMYDLRLGRWDRRYMCWRMPCGNFAAYRLIKEFKKEISACDPKIKELAIDYHQAITARESESTDVLTKGMKTTPWPHQAKALAFAMPLKGCALRMAMGTGKTLVAIAILNNRESKNSLIVCPKSVIDVWPHEFKKHSEINYNIHLALGKGTVKAKAKTAFQQLELAEARREPFVFVINYDSYWRDGMKEFILSTKWDNIVYDECHRLKTPGGVASKHADRIRKMNQDAGVLGLTGTLLPHSPLDAFAQYRAFAPDIFGSSYTLYKRRYAILDDFEGKMVLGFKNENELHEKINTIAFKVHSDVLNLPDEIDEYRTCMLSPKTWKVYEKLEQDLYAEIESGEITVANAMVKVLRLQQLTSGHIKTDEGEVITYGEEKKALLRDILEDIEKEEPVVVFARFTHDIQAIKQTCSELGRTCAELSGHANELRAWQEGEFNTIAVQIRSGGVGVDLTRSRYCFYYSIGHSLGDYLQSRARTNRPGQTRNVIYYHLLAQGTIDEKVYKALQNKEKIVNYILDGITEEHV